VPACAAHLLESAARDQEGSQRFCRTFPLGGVALDSRQFQRDEWLDALVFPLKNAGVIRWVN
jgi:hypothetical protein